jgi:5-methylcytosine-specific restriction protein A
MRSKHPCNYHGCKNLATERFCEMHKKQAEQDYDAHRGSAAERGYTATWAKVRNWKLARDPLCQRCQAKGIDRAAALVHHRDRDSRNSLEENLESLCKDCHVTEHKNERWKR